MLGPFDPGKPLAEPSTISWLSRFVVCLREQCQTVLGEDWRAEIDLPQQSIRVRRTSDRIMLAVPLHPGISVITPVGAAQRVIDQLLVAGREQGVLE